MARLVFDLDGTLIDSAPDIQAVANIVLTSEGAALLSLDETRRFVGRGARAFVQDMVSARGLPKADTDRLHQSFLEHYTTQVQLSVCYPGVVAALQAFAQAGHSLGICTNKPLDATHAVLTQLDLTRHFQVIIGGDTLAVRKPDPRPLQAAFDALGAGPALYFGDSETDAETARRAQIPFYLFTQGYRRGAIADIPHTHAFDSFKTLSDQIQAHLSGL